MTERHLRPASAIASLVCVALILAAGPVPAGTARLIGLGGDGGYFRDEGNVLHWYGSLVDHAGTAFCELGDVAGGHDDALSAEGFLGHGGGVHLDLDEQGTWGTLGFVFQDHLANGPTDGAFSCFWGRRLGAWQAGLAGRFSTYGQSAAGSAVGDRIDAQYFHRYGLGLVRHLGEGRRLELAGEVVNSKTEVKGALENLVADDWKSFGLRARAFWPVADRLTFVPVADHQRLIRGDYSPVLDAPADLDARRTSLGLAAHARPDPDTLILISGEYRHGREDWRLQAGALRTPAWHSSARDFYQIRGRIAVEKHVFAWLSLRAAAQYVRAHENVVHRSPAPSAEESPLDEAFRLEGVATPLALGCGLTHRSLTVDFAYNDTAPLNPGLGAEGLFDQDGTGFTALTVIWAF